jgi:DNA-binding NarL/FixJ family response regulator
MQQVKVLIVDDHALFRRGVCRVIGLQVDIEVVGEAEDGVEALAKARELKPDLILMDIRMPRGNGLEALSAIKGELPATKVVMLTIYEEGENLFEAIKRGAEGFLSKDVRAQDLVDAVRGVMRGKAALSERMAARITREFARLVETEAEDATSGNAGL